MKIIILLHGPMGAGKTTTSKHLHEAMSPCARVASPDVRRIVSGENHSKSDLAREVMMQMVRTYCQHELPVVLEIVCKAEALIKYQAVAAEYGYTFLPVLLTADEETRWQRVCMRTAEMMGVETLTKEKLAELQNYFDENNDFYSNVKGELGEVFDTTNFAPEVVVTYIMDKAASLS